MTQILQRLAMRPVISTMIALAFAVMPAILRGDGIASFIESGKIAWSGSASETVTNWVNGELVLKFTKSGTLTIDPELSATARLLVVGGGGAGGTATDTAYGAGGGGGAGGFLEIKDMLLVGGTYTATVGDGGIPNESIGPGGNGESSSFASAVNSISHIAGGGGGGGGQSAGRPGGNEGASGGGGSYSGASALGGAATQVQNVFANAGGISAAKTYGGGGGGALSVGEASGVGKCTGGDGKATDIYATEEWYAAGGGGGRLLRTGGYSGGQGGGGAGGDTIVEAEAAVANTGSGGGGSGKVGTGGAGGSGVVIVRITSALVTKVAVPSPVALTWNGQAQTGIPLSPAYAVSGDVEKTDAGTYSSTLTLNEGFTWLGQEGAAATEQKTIEWSIAKRTVGVPVPVNFTYDGQAKTGEVAFVSLVDQGFVTVSGAPLVATNAAKYAVVAALASVANETWADGTTAPKAFTWEIAPVKVTRPMPSVDLVYNGSLQAAPLPISSYYSYTAASQTNAFSAGIYHYYAELKNEPGTANYVWTTSPETETYHGTWQIVQAPNAIQEIYLVGWKLGEPTNAPSVKATWGADTAVYSFATSSNATEWTSSQELTTANAWTPGVWWVKATIPATADWASATALKEFVLWENPGDIFRDKAELSIGGLTEGADNVIVTVTFADDQPKGFTYERAGSDGEGLLFLDGEGTLLAYKVVAWNVKGVSTVKVQLASLTAAGTKITVYWGQRPNTVAPGSNASGVTGEDVAPSLDWGLVEQDGHKVNYWLTVPAVDKTVWYTTETPGVLANVPALAAGSVTNYIFDVYAPTNTYALTSELTTPGFYRWVFMQAAPTDGYAPIAYEIDLRVLGDVSVTQIGGTNGDSGRVLLMNRDTNTQCPIDYQGYSDVGATYWQHIHEDGVSLPYNLQTSSESVLLKDAVWLWHLVACRHGNTFPTSNTSDLNGLQNYLPWSATSYSFASRRTRANRATAGQIVMRNMTNACVYSSCLMDGIGTIYFDAVNGNANTDGSEYKIVVEVATETIPEMEGGAGLPPTDENCAKTDEDGEVLDPYAYANWRAVPLVPYLRDGTPDFVKGEPVMELPLAVKNGGTTKNFYRVVVPLDIHRPVRFRIRRVSRDETWLEDPAVLANGAGYILLDNVIASYPAMAASLTTAGWHDLDRDGVERQKGKKTLGVEGAFSVPYPAAGEGGVTARAVADYYANAMNPAVDTNTFFVSAKMHYRWRYLDQETNEWASVDLNPLAGFRSMQPLALPALAGDVEYFFESSLHAPYYKYVDYSGADTTIDFSALYSEKHDVVTNRAVCTGESFESRGTDWYVRLREASSNFRSLRLIVRRADDSETTHDCYLTDARNWTGFVKTHEADPEGLRVRIEALEPIALDAAGGVFATNLWALAADRSTLAMLPASVALTPGGTNDWMRVPCDAATGYLMFKVDDRSLSLTVSHADYQNFNGWSDAYTSDGAFVGTSTEDDKKSGVSSKMKEFSEDFAAWTDMPSTNTKLWQEPFSPLAGDTSYPANESFSSAYSPNGWTAQNGNWVWAQFLDTAAKKEGSSSYSQMALQLKGCGYGSVQYVDTAANAPRGLEKISLRARLAQAIDFESMSFSYSGSMLTAKDYTFFAHASFNQKTGKVDYDGEAAVSVLGYYQPMKGCYEFRVTQETMTTNKTGGVDSGKSTYRLSLYRWARASNGAVAATLLGEKRNVSSTALIKYTSGVTTYHGGLFISCQTDELNAKTKIVAGFMTSSRGIAIKPDANTEFLGLVCEDTADNRLKAGTYGVTSKNCPSEIWNPRVWMNPVTTALSLAATDAGVLPSDKRHSYAKTKINLDSGSGQVDGYDVLDGEWAVDFSRFDVVESGTSAGLLGTTLPQQLAIDVAPAGTMNWTTLTNVTVNGFTLSTPYVPVFHSYETCSVRIRHAGSDADPRMDVVVDDIQLWQWAGDDMGGRDSEKWAGTDYSGWPNSFYFSSCWIQDKSVIMSAKRTPADKFCTLRAPLMDGHGTPVRGIGLGMLSFEYANAQENVNLLVQVAKGVADSVRLQNGSNDSKVWETVTNFNFAAMTPQERAKGVCSVYLGMHGVQGTMRLLLDPEVVAAVASETNPKRFGEVTIKRIFCRDEPSLDITCWWGWNMRMIGSSGNAAYPVLDNGQRSYLPDVTVDPADLGLSLILNNSTEESAGCRHDDLEAYKQHMPFVQTPTFASNVVGEISFRARLWGTRADEPQQIGEVALYGATSGDLTSDSAWKELTRFDVTNRFYATYTYRTESSEQKYRAFRLGVTGVKGVTDSVSRGRDPVHGAEPVRVLIDEVAVYEAVWPTIGFRYAYPFRNMLDSSLSVTGIVDAAGAPLMDEQPLAGEGWSVQAEIEVRQLPDEIDLKTPGREPRVFFAWYSSTNVWGYANWRTNATRRVELARADDSPMVFRGSYTKAREAVVNSQPAQVVQYATEVVYWTVSGVVQTNVLSASEWRTPSWYAPLDYNKTYGASSGDFSAWTVLDDIAPKRVWINEVNVYDGTGDMFWTGDDQWIELAVPLSQKITGWKLEYINQQFETHTLCTFGPGGVADSKTANEKDGYVFLAVQNPATRTAGRWPQSGVMDGTWADFNGYGGQLDQTSPVALRLTRASGVVEQEIVFEGENMYAGTLWEDIYNASNHVNDLNAHFQGANFRFVGDEYKSPDVNSLGVVTNTGAQAVEWSKAMVKTPGRVNEGQTVPLGYALYPNGDLLLVTARIGGEGHIVQTFGSVVASAELATAATRKGDEGTNITYQVDKWWEIKSITANGVPLPGVEGLTDTVVLTIGAGQSNNIDVVATAQPLKVLREQFGLTEDNRYRNAILDWLAAGKTRKYGAFKGTEVTDDAWYKALNGTVVTNLTLTHRYWLDIDPTEPGWVFRAGVISAPKPYYADVMPVSYGPIEGPMPSDPVNPWYDTVTNLTIKVKMSITNEQTAVAHSPYMLRGLQPGSDSYRYVDNGSVLWTSVTFKVTGDIQNGMENRTRWVPLRYFVFNAGSFDEDHTATIDIWDPFDPYGSPATKGWSNFTNCPVFYSWAIDERLAPSAIEPLKADSTYRGE